MVKSRRTVPKAIRDLVLNEFNHRCAICAADYPQLHHLDENPENNVLENLLPLCANCHLMDQHNPTRRHDPGKPRLFRHYKDPCILRPQFAALYNRFFFLESITMSEATTTKLDEQASELISFVRALEMGDFYGEQLEKLLKRGMPALQIQLGDGPDPERERQIQDYNRRYRMQLIESREHAIELCVELLRFQNWT